MLHFALIPDEVIPNFEMDIYHTMHMCVVKRIVDKTILLQKK